jgi:hypothetical protein
VIKTFWVAIVAVLTAALVTVSCISKPVDGGATYRKPSAEDEVRKYPPEEFPDGFAILDVIKDTPYGNKGEVIKPFMSEEDIKKVNELIKDKKMKAFEPLYIFDALAKDRKLDKDEPWLKENLDLSKKADAEKLAKLLQAYVYEGWFNQDTSKDKTNYDMQFRQNKQRTWCQTPWLNVTEKGREALHGLTKEFPISTTSVYTVPEDIDKGEEAVTWGVGFFNRKICDGYDHFFHPSKFGEGGENYEEGIAQKIKDRTLDFKAADGAVTFKLLFSAMPNWQENMKGQWDGAYNWYAHVSHARQDDKPANGDESQRQLMNIPHVQMDIGFKDSRVKGTDAKLKNWVMMTYYFDPGYDANEYLKDKNMPAALRHMRPVGLQYGLEEGQSYIFDGSRNNHRPKGDELPYEQTRLNGPVDNKQSSCLGCHAVSGINFGLAGGKRAPGLGFMSQADYDKYFELAGNKSFDFDMQIDKAMRNFSRPRLTKYFLKISNKGRGALSFKS